MTKVAAAERLLLAILLSLAAAGQEDAMLQIETSRLRVAWEPAGTWSAHGLAPDGQWVAFASEATFIQAGATATRQDLADPVFGPGQAIEIEGPTRRLRLAIYESSPFVHVTGWLKAAEAGAVDSLDFGTVTVLPERSVDQLTSLGTAGLKPLGQQPGSYVFLAVAEPRSRAGVVSGWLTCETASGVIFTERDGDRARLRPRADWGLLPLAAGQLSPPETWLLGWFDDARLGLEAYADTVAQALDIHLPPCPSGYCTWYSRPHGGACDQRHLAELSTYVEREMKRYGLDFIQIDDGWQLGRRDLPEDPAARKTLGEPNNAADKWFGGPAADFTGHRPDGPYPDGMAPAAADLSQHGLRPGIWLLPFAWNPLSPPLAGHREWFAQQAPGQVYFTRWAGWCLDTSHPEALTFLADTIRRVTHDWGYRYLKLDGLYAGLPCRLTYVNNGYRDDQFGDALRHDPSETLVAGYRAGLRTVREAAGDDVFLLGCNVSQNMRSFAASFGLLDAMRIGPDNGPGWEALKRGPWHGSNRYFLHGRVWHNDPDPVYVRDSMPLAHARLIASWVSLTGQLYTASDWLPELPDERLDILKRTLRNHGLKPRPVDLFEHDLPRIWHLQSERGGVRRDVIGLFNWDDAQSWQVDEAVEHLGLPQAPEYVAFDFWGDTFLQPFGERLRCDVPPASCRILAIRPAVDHPQVVATSQHVTGGVIDLLAEHWDPVAKELSGTSELIAGDDYELRIDAAGGVAAVSADGASGAVVSQDGRQLRVRLRSEHGGPVKWRVEL